jgi:hypothetical protein
MIPHRRTPARPHRPLACGVAWATIAIASAACTTTTEQPTASLVPLVPPEILPVSTPAPSTTIASSSDPNDPLLATLPDTECSYADPIPDGEITFVVGDRLYGIAADASIVRCLAALRPEQRGPVSWSPTATRVLLNAGTLFDIVGSRASGFDVANVKVQWEYPDGAGVFGPTSSGRTLVRRDAADPTQRSEVTFLGRTTVAIAHPGGGVRIAAGQADDGTQGIFAATDAGDGVRPLATVLDPALDVLELAADPAGDAIWILSDNGAQFRIRQLSLGDLALGELTSEQAPISQLTSGPATRSLAWKVGLCNSVTIVRVLDARTGGTRTAGEGTPLAGQSLAPIGWFDAARVLVAARPLGCDGPADVWSWNLLDGSATLVVKNVEFPAIRLSAPLSGPFAVSPAAQPSVL